MFHVKHLGPSLRGLSAKLTGGVSFKKDKIIIYQRHSLRPAIWRATSLKEGGKIIVSRETI